MTDSTDNLDYAGALAFLHSRINYERRMSVPYRESYFKLDRMRELLRRLGQPDAGQRIVHVAGTKGKGSTAAMIAAILTAAGYRTGLYTSPHLERVEERMAVDGVPCSPDDLVQLARQVRPAVEWLDAHAPVGGEPLGRPTYFEVTTAMALLYFARRGVDATVLEVGLGGRLDSTNVCRTALSVITSISFDHTEQLGDTLAAIAGEKAGIIKPGVPVVSGVTVVRSVTGDEPQGPIRRKAAAEGCRLVELDVDFAYDFHVPHGVATTGRVGSMEFAGCGAIDFRWLREDAPRGQRDCGGRHDDEPSASDLCGLELGLLGRHQGTNAAVAVAAIGELRRAGWTIGAAAVRRGLAMTRVPARVEVVGRRPTVIVDTAHNVASIGALADVLDDYFGGAKLSHASLGDGNVGGGDGGIGDGDTNTRPNRGQRLLIFAATQGKDYAGMLRRIVPRFDQVLLTQYAHNPRGVPVERLAAAAASWGGVPLHLCVDPQAAWRRAQSLAGPDDLICIAGSFFIAAELRSPILAEMSPMHQLPPTFAGESPESNLQPSTSRSQPPADSPAACLGTL